MREVCARVQRGREERRRRINARHDDPPPGVQPLIVVGVLVPVPFPRVPRDAHGGYRTRVASNGGDDSVSGVAQRPAPAAVSRGRGQAANLARLDVHLHDRLTGAPRRLKHHRARVRQPRVVGGRRRDVQPREPAGSCGNLDDWDDWSVLLRGVVHHRFTLVPAPGHGAQRHGGEVRAALHRAVVREPHEGVAVGGEPRPRRRSRGPRQPHGGEPGRR
mmetsp:Transcript_5330/g.21820  ORF Transcript_5330/g.21820 Transcript_5330/m.21820 type:complete len:218 (-) Transcript_5330:323-976(-)